MIDENLSNFVRTQIENGVSKDVAVRALLQNGWRVAEVNSAYNMIEQNLANNQVANPTAPPPSQGTSIIMKLAIFIIILVFIIGTGLFVYLKFFDGNIEDIFRNIPYVKELIAPKTSDLLK